MKPAAFPTPSAHGLGEPLADFGVRLRGARDDDLPFLLALYATTRAEELAPVPWPEATKAAFLNQQFALQHHHYLTGYPRADFLLLEAQDGPVGRFYRAAAPEGADPAECDLVIDVSLLPPWRGRGLGTALLHAAMASAAARGRAVALHVLLSNVRARRLYERLGFAVTDEAGAHLAMRWRPAGAPLPSRLP